MASGTAGAKVAAGSMLTAVPAALDYDAGVSDWFSNPPMTK